MTYREQFEKDTKLSMHRGYLITYYEHYSTWLEDRLKTAEEKIKQLSKEQ